MLKRKHLIFFVDFFLFYNKTLMINFCHTEKERNLVNVTDTHAYQNERKLNTHTLTAEHVIYTRTLT